MKKNAQGDVDRIMNEAVEAASEMSALLREAESSRKEAEQLLKQIKVGSSAKVKDYLAGKRQLNEDEQVRMDKIRKKFKEEVGDLEHSRKEIEEVTRELESLHLGDLLEKGRKRINI